MTIAYAEASVMITLVWVGPNKVNRSGVSVKAYTIRRSGRKVMTESGHIDVISRKYFWRYGNHPRIWRFRSADAARQWAKGLMTQKLSKSKGYRRLPSGVRIRRRTKLEPV